ncbi:hypothetical protein PLICRDRAFT_51117 [Plicaturopsis crispa FD-325 SS-3]|nr:hypothetical protein PLICRDRAFT_51117 [Plicaturopsis crispa FD-325 SS-3]
MTTHFGVLPQDLLDTLALNLEDAQFLRLPHPRTGVPSLFLPYRNKQQSVTVLEVQAITPPNARSWFMGNEVIADGKMLVMTPIDPAFLLIPLLQAIQPEDGTAGTFRRSEDLFDEAAARVAGITHPTLKDPSAVTTSMDIQRFTALPCVLPALRRICDVKEVTEEITVFRYSPTKLTEYLRAKVSRLANADGVMEGSRTVLRGLAKDGLMEDGKESLLESGKLKAACDLVGQYLPPETRALLLASYDFAALNAHNAALASEAAALIATSAPKKKKAATKAEKEKEEKDKKGLKRKGSSHGVEQLKKASTTGMKKMTSFFSKA